MGRYQNIGDTQAHAVRAFFFIGGFGSASWAPLVPLLRERLSIGDDVLGLLLLCVGIGSLVTMPLAGMGFSVFSAAMFLMRLFGDAVVQRLGQRPVAVGGALLACAGILLVMFAPVDALLYAGFFAIGIGAANIVPVFFSLMGKQDVMPIGAAVSAVSTMGYLGILAGPAAIGFVSHMVSLQAAFGILAVLCLVQACVGMYVFRRIS